ncbi:MAG: hypothetical protein IKF19_05310 [Bacilli bacterium]|nr:hypothetical protein [Bacilli bacterium]
MAIKIKTFKNVYGINNLKGLEAVNGNALIYAPNGGTKTSLALGFKSISVGIKPNDRIFEKESEFSFILDEREYNDKNLVNIDNIVVYNFEEYYKDSLENSGDKLSLITMSTVLNKKYGDIYQNCLDKIDILSKKISSIIGNKKKENDNVSMSLDFFKNNFNLHNWKDIIMFLSKIEWEDKIETEYNLCNILNGNTVPIISSSNFIEQVVKLNETINSKIESVLFKGSFGSLEANKLIREISSDGFFEAGHAIKLYGMDELITSANQFENIYNEQLNVIYNNDETKKEVEDLLSKINKNKATREIRNFISDPNIITQMDDYNKFSFKLLSGSLQSLETEIKETSQAIKNSENAINDLMKKANEEQTKWEEICEVFNDRFIVPFSIKVKNRFNSIIGRSYPTFEIKYEKNNNEKIITEDLLKKTLSTGEVRALTILHFLFDLNVSINKNNETFVILDDIVDSFDYKNKYAMIEYIAELSKEEKNIICWVLTHNFDFFSSCKYRVNGFDKYYIKKNKDSENFQRFNESIIGGGMELFNNWKEMLKNNSDEKKFVSLIPVCRNLVELKYGRNDARYEMLCNILHYRLNTKNISVGDIDYIFVDTFNINSNIESSKKVFDIIFEQLGILSTSNLSNSIGLDDKIILAIGIRIVMEIIFSKFDSSFMKKNLTLGDEFDSVKEYFDTEEIKVFSMALISVPEFIHLNSFMYEPLVDIPTTNLQNIYKKIIKIKDKYFFNK